MKSTGCSQRRRRASGLHAAVGAAAALSLLLTPGAATAQKTNPEVKRTTFDRWEMLCPANACGILTRAVRGMLIVGFSNQTNDVLFQVRLPAEAAEQGPVALRLHKSGTVLHMRVNKCLKEYCIANSPPAKLPEVLKVFSKESSGTLGYEFGQTLQLEVFSLAGFNRAYSELMKHRPKAPPKKQ